MNREVEALLAKMAEENRKEEAQRPGPSRQEITEKAAFLKKWAKGKPITRQSSEATFWAAGKLMTKLDAKMAEALAAGGFATLTGSATERGATLKML